MRGAPHGWSERGARASPAAASRPSSNRPGRTRAARPRLTGRARPQEGAGEDGAVVEGELATGLQAARFAAGVDVGVTAPAVGPAAADPQLAGDGDAVSVGDPW